MDDADITKSNYTELSRDTDFLSSILTLTDALPKNLTQTLTLTKYHNLTGVIKMSQFRSRGKLLSPKENLHKGHVTQHVTKSTFSPINFQWSVFTLCHMWSVGISMQKYTVPCRFYSVWTYMWLKMIFPENFL